MVPEKEVGYQTRDITDARITDCTASTPCFFHHAHDRRFALWSCLSISNIMQWTVGTIIGPTIGGFLADPVTNHPNWFKGEPPALFKRFPFCLPNLVNSALFIYSLLIGTLFLKVYSTVLFRHV